MKKAIVWLIILLMALGLAAGAFQAFRGMTGPSESSDISQSASHTTAGAEKSEPAYNTRQQVYANSHPELTEAEVKRDIRLGLDRELYEDSSTVSDPNAVDVFVSKHWQLPEDYVPADLVEVQSVQLRQPAADAWNELVQVLEGYGISLIAQTGWISPEDTNSLYEQAVQEYGQERADSVFSKPGFFDSNTGLSVDFGIEGVQDPAADSRYDQIIQEAAKHGFILRYTAENEKLSQTAAQPLHLRFVGKDLADILGNESVSFDEYYGTH